MSLTLQSPTPDVSLNTEPVVVQQTSSIAVDVGHNRKIAQIDILLRNCPVSVQDELLQERELRQANMNIKQKKNGMGNAVKTKEQKVKETTLAFKKAGIPYAKAKSGDDKVAAAIRLAITPFANDDDFGEKVMTAARMLVHYKV
eukprot:COSAG01_NODE_8732_length_2679_cov_12.481008_5_plen_144_part_00